MAIWPQKRLWQGELVANQAKIGNWTDNEDWCLIMQLGSLASPIVNPEQPATERAERRRRVLRFAPAWIPGECARILERGMSALVPGLDSC